MERKPPSESKNTPSVSTCANPKPPAVVRLQSNRWERESLCTLLPNGCVKYDPEGLPLSQPGDSDTHQLLGSGNPPGCLVPLETPELQQLTSSDTKQPAQPFTTKAPSEGSLGTPASSLAFQL